MRFLRLFAAFLAAAFISASAQTWQRTATNGPNGAGVPLLLTDGTVMVHNANTSQWWKLKPDAFGNYQSGTWSALANMPAGHSPLYYASAVLADGRVVVIGGEYNGAGAVWTNKSSIYDPVAGTWAVLTPPFGTSSIGDAQCCVLPDGRFMVCRPADTQAATLNPTTLAWTPIGTGKADRYDEEGWTLLPEGTILTVDAINAPATEKFIISTGVWFNSGNTPAILTAMPSQELGPAVLLPNGKVFAIGGTPNNALYTPGLTPSSAGSWAAAPSFPIAGYDEADGPACLLPSGNVLCFASPGVFNTPSHCFIYDGTSILATADPPNAVNDTSYVGNFLVLPNGQVLFTDFSNDVEIYTPAGLPSNAWRPTITSCPTVLAASQTFTIQGTQFNGLSQCCMYGDDSSNATNYPLVRITNIATGHVFYCRTKNHSTMAVATGSLPTSTTVTVSATVENGASNLQVVANGIASQNFNVTIGTVPQLSSLTVAPNTVPGGTSSTGTVQLDMNAQGAGATVTLQSNNPAAQVPASVLVPTGSATASFTITTSNPAAVTTATITASYLGTNKQATLQINPAPYVIHPATMSISPGSEYAGSVGLPGMQASEDSWLIMRPGAVFINTQAPISLTLTGNGPAIVPSQLEMFVESAATNTGITQKIEVYIPVLNTWEQVNFSTLGLTDSVVNYSTITSPERFIDQVTGSITARLSYKATTAVFVYPWRVQLDEVYWRVTP